MRSGMTTVAIEALVNVAAPFAIYVLLDDRLGDVGALLYSMAPPVLWSVVGVIRKRRLDAFSVFVVVGIGLSIVLALGTHSARMLQIRENFVTLLIGLLFLGSAAMGRPLAYELALASRRRLGEDQAKSFAALKVHAGFRRSMTVMTLAWGFGMVAVFGVSVVLVYVLTIPTYLFVSPIVAYGMIGMIALWTILHIRRAKRRGAERAALAQAQSKAEGADDP